MVISFSVKEARDQLMNNCTVYTFRWNKRKQTGKDWANEKRGGKKIADVFIDEPGLIEAVSDLSLYVSQSGFKNVKDWLDVIMSMTKEDNMYGLLGYLYKVTLRDVITYEITCGGCGTVHACKNLPEKIMCKECQEAYWVDDYKEIHSLKSQQLRNSRDSGLVCHNDSTLGEPVLHESNSLKSKELRLTAIIREEKE